MTLAFDPTGKLPANLFTNEAHVTVTEPDVWPINGTFYGSSFSVTGVDSLSGISRPLVYLIDFMWSPLFMSLSASTGREVYSYILLTDYTKWSSLDITYQATGGGSDPILTTQIIGAGNFDRTNIQNWLSFLGSSVSLGTGGNVYDLQNKGVAYLFSAKLKSIADNMGVPSSYIDYINGQITALQNSIASLTAITNTWNTSLTNSGILSGTITPGGVIGATGPTGHTGNTGNTGNTGPTGTVSLFPYLMAGFHKGLTTASDKIFLFVPDAIVTLPTNFTGASARALTAATAITTFSIEVNGISVGTMTFAAGGTVATFASASPVTINPGDMLAILAPATPDTTLADFAYSLKGTQ